VILGAPLTGDCLELEAAFTLDLSATVGIRVRRAAGGKAAAEVLYNAANGLFSLGAANSPVGRQKQVRIRVFLDKCVVEAFANDGTAAIFLPLHAATADQGIEIFARNGKAQLDSLRVWPMRPARMTLDRFHT
jgi:sucrose-6-phosphate hydrolase SacC (GH32 family)